MVHPGQQEERPTQATDAAQHTREGGRSREEVYALAGQQLNNCKI